MRPSGHTDNTFGHTDNFQGYFLTFALNKRKTRPKSRLRMRKCEFKNIVKNTKNILRVFVFTTKVAKNDHREVKDLTISIFHL